ncbi:MAG: NADH-quinone oxidoreductase subunit NuoK [Chloroflexi bacterium]|nr:NADH-quinone oxidoreductase subunit NuoK [Chloroflexota bacterium]
MAVSVTNYTVLSAMLFTIGIIGVLTRRNAIIVFMSIELMLNAGNLAFIAFSRAFGSVDGQIFVFFVLTVAAAEVAIGLALIVTIFRSKNTADIDDISTMRG